MAKHQINQLFVVCNHVIGVVDRFTPLNGGMLWHRMLYFKQVLKYIVSIGTHKKAVQSINDMLYIACV